MNGRLVPLQLGFDRRQLAILTAAFLAATVAVCIWIFAAYALGATVAFSLLVAAIVVALVLKLPLAGICLAVVAAPLEYLAANVGNGSFSLTPSEAILIVTAFSAALRLLPTISPAQIPAALYAFWGLVLVSIGGLFVAIETFVVIRIVLDWVAFGIIALFVSQRSAAELRAIGVSLAVACGVLGAMSLGSLTDQKAIAGGAIVANRAAASFAHPTALAFFLLLTFPMAFVLALRRGPLLLRAVMMACGVLGLIGLMLTQTRGSIIGAAVALVWMAYRWPPFRRLALTSLAAVAVVAALNVGTITSSQPVTVLSKRLGTLSLESRGDDRLKIWATTPDVIATSPLLGVGQDNFPAVSPKFGLLDEGGVPFDHAHDLFLNVAAELGVVGLLILLLLIAALFRSARAALAHRDSDLYPLVVAVSASLLALLINSLTEYPLRENLIMATVMIDIGLLLGMERLLSSRRGPRSRSGRRPAPRSWPGRSAADAWPPPSSP